MLFLPYLLLLLLLGHFFAVYYSFFVLNGFLFVFLSLRANTLENIRNFEFQMWSNRSQISESGLLITGLDHKLLRAFELATIG